MSDKVKKCTRSACQAPDPTHMHLENHDPYCKGCEMRINVACFGDYNGEMLVVSQAEYDAVQREKDGA